ncbi:hypothetical protein N7512_006403 [Penicillium capsulatum]|nr:hypothetical protein N7512_006403 [Penicillium capsulatum]
MDPSKTQDDPPPSDNDRPNANSTMPPSQDLSDSLNRLSLANAAATPLPISPSLLSPHDAPARPVQAQPAPRRTPSSTSLRDERRKSIPALQKRLSTASLRSVSNTGPASPIADSSRRSSTNFAGSPTTSASPAMWPPRLTPGTPEPQIPTAAAVAAEHFHRELDIQRVVEPKCKTVVLVHDACYGHRFERPRTNKKELSTIVERPERIRACVLGISAAYVRLGRRYGLDMYSADTAPFRIRKTSRTLALSDTAVTSVHGTQWMTDLTSMCNSAEPRLALNPSFRGAELVRPRDQHTENPEPAFHSGDLYLCSKSLNALEGALGGVCDGIDAVFGPGPASRAHGLTHAVILDFDLHHGDGSQDITWKHNAQMINAKSNAAPYEKTAIGYYSLHDINSYPCEDGGMEKVSNASVCIDGAHGQSIWNIHLDTWETEDDFWHLYKAKYTILINKARAFLHRQAKLHQETPNGPTPKAAIFISAGFDASEWESPGMQRHKVHVPTSFYARFTADVVRMSQEEGLGADGRVISVLEGGYSDRALTSGVLSHLSGLGGTTLNESGNVREALELASRRGSVSPQDSLKRPSAHVGYDPKWWSPEQLDELEGLVSKRSTTFDAPTRSSSAKAVTPTRDRRSQGSYPGMDPVLYPSTEVGWATAAQELCKVLIPETRQTMSCRPEDLSLPASRQRYDRQAALDGNIDLSAIPPPPSVPGDDKRQLRVRKAKSPTPFSPRPATPRQQAMRKNRRKTFDGNEVPDPSRESSPSLDASRRKSATATTPVAMGDLTAGQGAPTDALPQEVPPRPASTSGTRKTSGSRSGTPRRTASPRKPPPVPKVPSAFLPSKLAEQSTPTDDVDSLAASVQKIKLVMPSPEEQAIREQKALDELKQPSKTPKAPKSPRSPRKTSAPKTTRGKSPGRAAKTPINSPPILPTPTMGFASTDKLKHEIPSRAVSSPLPSAMGSAESSNADVMFPAAKPQEWIAPNTSVSNQQSMFTANTSPPLTPENPPTSNAAHLQSGVFSPPMSEAQTRTGLPVFTSNTPIPFAKQPSNSNTNNAQN